MCVEKIGEPGNEANARVDKGEYATAYTKYCSYVLQEFCDAVVYGTLCIADQQGHY